MKESGTFKEYYELLSKSFEYLQRLLFDFKMRKLSMLNEERDFIQYKSEELVHIILPLTSHLRALSRKVSVKCIGPVMVHKIIDTETFLPQLKTSFACRYQF